MTNDEQTRAAIENFANEVSDSLPNYATQQEMEIARRGFQRGIAYRDKQLAETAGQGFDFAKVAADSCNAVQFPDDGYSSALAYQAVGIAIEQTAASFTARIEELDNENGELRRRLGNTILEKNRLNDALYKCEQRPFYETKEKKHE